LCSIWRDSVEPNPAGTTINQFQIVASLGFIATGAQPYSIVSLPGGSCNCSLSAGIYLYNALNPSQPLNANLTNQQIGLLLLGNNCEIYILTGCRAPVSETPTQTPTQTPTSTVTPTNTPSPTVTPTNTPSPTVTPSTPGAANPDASGCSVLYNVNAANTTSVYLYDPSTNTSTLLNNITNLSTSTDIAHTDTKLYMSESGSPNLKEWDITLSPNFTATYVTTHVLPFNLGAGLAVVDDTNVILTSADIRAGDTDIWFYEYNTSTEALTQLFPIGLHGTTPQLCRVSGDMILTSDSKLIALVDNKIGAVNASRQQWIVQYSYPDGAVELELEITSTITSAGAYGYAMYEYGGELYIAGGPTASPWQYTVDLNSPFALTSVAAPPNKMEGASQVPGCINNSFVTCTPPGMNGKLAFLAYGYVNNNAPSTNVNWYNDKLYTSAAQICNLVPTIDGYLNNPSVCSSCVVNYLQIYYTSGQFVKGARLYTNPYSCDCDKIKLPDGFYVINLNNSPSYQWAAGQTNIQFAVVTVSNCIITDIYTCTAVQSLNAVCNPTNATSFGANDGILNLTITGGYPPYTVTYNGNQVTLPLIKLVAGTYTLVVTDSVKGTYTITCTITEPACVRPTTNMTLNVQVSAKLINSQGTPYIFASVENACQRYLGPTFANWTDFPSWTVDNVRIDIYNWDPTCPGGNCGTIYTPGSTSCGCNISNLPSVPFWITYTIPTNVNLNPVDGVYICTRIGCVITSVTACAPSLSTAPQGIRVLSQAGTTMSINGQKNLSPVISFIAQWNDSFDANGQSTNNTNYSVASGGGTWGVTHAYTQTGISAFLYNWSGIDASYISSPRNLTISYLSGFISTPQTLTQWPRIGSLFITNYYLVNSIGFSTATIPNNTTTLNLQYCALSYSFNSSNFFNGLATNNFMQNLQIRYGKVSGFVFNMSQMSSLLAFRLYNMDATNSWTSLIITVPTQIEEIQIASNGSVTNGTGLTTIPTINGLSSITSVGFNLLLNNNNLTGIFNLSLPSTINSLNLNTNRLSEFSSNLTGLNSLTSLLLSTNLLTVLPSSLNLPSTLVTLDLSLNRLNDSSFNTVTITNSVQTLSLNGNLLTTLPTIPNNCITLQIGLINDNTDGSLSATNGNRNNFGNFNYNLSTKQITTLTAENCGITSFTPTLNGQIRTISLKNAVVATYRANTISSIDLNAPGKSYATITSLDLTKNGSLNSISNLGSCTSLISLKASSCAFTNTTQILSTNNLSVFPTLSTLELYSNNFGSNFTLTFGGTQLTSIDLRDCGLTASIIDGIIQGLVNTLLNNVTLKLENIAGGTYDNCNRSSISNTAFATLTSVQRNFTITLTENPVLNPQGGIASNSSISPSWTLITNATGYEIRYKKNTDATYGATISLGIVSNYLISSLSPATIFNVQVRTKFGTGSSTYYSCWSTGNYFTV
jgi:hypothetical protein